MVEHIRSVDVVTRKFLKYHRAKFDFVDPPLPVGNFLCRPRGRWFFSTTSTASVISMAKALALCSPLLTKILSTSSVA